MDEKTGFDNVADLLHIVLFGGFPKKMTEIVGENAAAMLLRECSKESFLMALSQPNSKLKPAEDIRKHIDKNDFTGLFDYCYRVLDRVGFPYEGEVLVDKDLVHSLKITKCPHHDYVMEQPIACNVCKGIKLGILEAAYGESVEVESLKNMARGDEYCLSVFRLPDVK